MVEAATEPSEWRDWRVLVGAYRAVPIRSSYAGTAGEAIARLERSYPTSAWPSRPSRRMRVLDPAPSGAQRIVLLRRHTRNARVKATLELSGDARLVASTTVTGTVGPTRDMLIGPFWLAAFVVMAMVISVLDHELTGLVVVVVGLIGAGVTAYLHVVARRRLLAELADALQAPVQVLGEPGVTIRPTAALQ